MNWKVANLVARLAFGGLFFYTGIRKVRDPISFLDSVRGFRSFEHFSTLTGLDFDPSPLEAWIAMGLPWLEIFCGTAVMLGIFHRGGLAMLCSLLLLFVAALASAWSRGLEIKCGCFSDALVTNYFLTILLRLGLLAAGLVLLLIALRENAAKSLAEAK